MDVARVIADLSTQQHGAVARRQLLAAGLSSKQVEGAYNKGLLIRERQGVYRAAATPPTTRGALMAAVLAAGTAATVTHRPGAALWKMIPPTRRPPGGG